MWNDYKQSCPGLDGVKHHSRISRPQRWTCCESRVWSDGHAFVSRLTGWNRRLRRKGPAYSPIMSEVKPPPMWMVRLNVAMLRRGLRIGSQHLLSVRGRKSGEVRSTPISIATIDGSRYMVAAFSKAAWVQNVRAAGAGTLGRGRNVEQVRLVELPVEERGPVLRGFLRQVRGGVRFFGSADPDVVVAAADRYPVFRLDSN